MATHTPSRSLSAYLVYRLGDPVAQEEAARFSGNAGVRFEYTVISNIYSGGLPPAEAGGVIGEKICDIVAHKAAGNRLEDSLKKPTAALRASVRVASLTPTRAN